MSGVRVGVDIVPLRRAAEMVAGDPQVLLGHLSQCEIDDSRRRGVLDVSCVAGRLAGKEAVFKLFRRPGAVLPWRSITITIASGGWPGVDLSGRAAVLAEQAALSGIDLSIAHDGGYAIAAASAVLESTDRVDPPHSASVAPTPAATTMKGPA